MSEKTIIRRPRVLTVPTLDKKSPSSIKCALYIPRTNKIEIDPNAEYEQWYYYHNRPPKEREWEHPKYCSTIQQAPEPKERKRVNFAIEA